MSNLSRKSVIIIICAVVAAAGLIAAVVILAGNSGDDDGLNGTVVNVADKKQEVKNYIIDWDSSTKKHDPLIGNLTSKPKCSITVGTQNYVYEDFNEAWVDATTTYKNKGDLVFTLYADWVADENGVFGTDEGTAGTSYINGSGGLLIKNWENNITIDFNGYKIDRNMTGETEDYGTVIKIDESENVYFKNGCITGGACSGDGGGVLIYGKYKVYFEGMTITGNVTGNNGGGVYVGSHAKAYFTDTTIEGNVAENYGGGVYADYKTYKQRKSIYLSEIVKIQNNIGSDYRNNLTFCADVGNCAQIFDVELSEGSSIYVSSSLKDSLTRTFVENYDYDENNDSYFHADDSECKIVKAKISVDDKSGTKVPAIAKR